MARTITVGTDQPALSPRPKKGEPVTADQFSMDFSVEVEQDGCYVVEFVLKEHRIFPVTDDVILSTESAWAQPVCLHAGPAQNFRIGTSKPGPAGSAAPPAPPAGTVTLAPVDGHWPSHISSSGEFYYEIEVYRVADCAATPPPCQPHLRSLLKGENKYMTRSGEKSTVDRELAATQSLPESPAACGLSAPVSVTANPQVLFELQRGTTNDTFQDRGVIASRFETTRAARRLSARVALRDTFPALEDLGQALATCERVSLELQAGKTDGFLRGFLAERGVIRHGRATFFDPEQGPLTTFFINDRNLNVTYPGMGPAGIPFPAGTVLTEAAPGAPPPAPPPVDGEEVSVGFPDRFGTGIHLFAPLVNIFARIAFKYESSIAAMIADVFDPLIAAHKCIKRLRIHSHGGPLEDGNSSTINGSFIEMGDNQLRSSDFDAAGTVLPGTLAADLVAKLQAVMCHPGEIVFDACNQGVGDLLKNLSKALGPDRTIKGYANTGVPWGEGDRSFLNGSPQ